VDDAWNAFDEGYLSAHKWAEALAGGAPLPVEQVPIPLEPDEVAHAHLAPVTVLAYVAENKQYPPALFVFGGPLTLAVTGAVAIGRDAAWRGEAQRAVTPRWHRLGTVDLVVTDRRLLATGQGKTASVAYTLLGPSQLVPGADGGPSVQVQPSGQPALQLESPWSPLLYVFMHQLADGRPPPLPMPPAVVERARAEGRLS
jgi:hypothetical protein